MDMVDRSNENVEWVSIEDLLDILPRVRPYPINLDPDEDVDVIHVRVAQTDCFLVVRPE